MTFGYSNSEAPLNGCVLQPTRVFFAGSRTLTKLETEFDEHCRPG
jgi:hypothetical protein